MDEHTPLLAFLVAVVAVLAVALVARPHEPAAPAAALAPQSLAANVTSHATANETTKPAPTPAPNATANATSEAPAATPTSPTSPPPPARTRPNPSPSPSPSPAANATNRTVSWNATLGGDPACVPGVGVPLCAPTGNGGAASASKALGGGDIKRGALDATWTDQSAGAAFVTLRVVAGSGCSGDVCKVQRDLNLTTSGGSPLRLALANVTLEANETLLVVLELDCSATFGSCAGTSESVHVAGWILREVTTS